MKIISWNVNGFRAVLGKGFKEFFEKENADIFCIQETKMLEGQAEFSPEGYYQYWNSALKKGYSGTAIFTKIKPINVTYGIGEEKHDGEGRVITAEYDDFFLVNVYTPNSQRELTRLEYRMEWDEAFRNYLTRLDHIKPVVCCGDMNVAHEEIDIKNPKSNHRNAGFTDEERNQFSAHLKAGFADTFRRLYPDTVRYSWWSYMMKAREKNIGWRIDYFIASERFMEKVKDSLILTDVYGSDHCPVEIITAC